MSISGYETKQAREAHLKALVTELADVKRAVTTARATLKDVPEDKPVEKAQREQDLERLQERIPAIEDQLSAFRGEAPHRRAQKRDDPGVEKR